VVFFGSAPIVFADHSDDKKKKLADLIAEVKGKKKDKKCKEDKKYEGVCDTKKPKVKIDSPKKNSMVTSPVTVTGTATDKGVSGVASVMVEIDKGGFVAATTFDPSTGEFTFDAGELDPGKHKVTVKVTDFVGNEKSKKVKFTVI